MILTLYVIGGDGTLSRSETRDVQAARFTIGRIGCDWDLPDPKRLLSRVHCIIERVDDSFTITDVSRNGVYLNSAGNRLGNGVSVRLKDGDRIRIGGDHQIEVTLSTDAAAGADAIRLPDDWDAIRLPVPPGSEAAVRRLEAPSPADLAYLSQQRSKLGGVRRTDPLSLAVMQELRASEAARVALDRSVRQADADAEPEVIDVSAFAPRVAAAGGETLLQVFLHRLEQAELAAALAAAAEPDASRRGVATLAAAIPRGKWVDILVDGTGLSVDEPLQSVIWRGEPCACQFVIGVPDTVSDGAIVVRVRVVLDGVPIGSLRFSLSVSTVNRFSGIGQRGEAARRYQRAFLSYATIDRPEVLKRAQALRAAGISFFQDVLSLEPGERWERRLYDEIDRCDLFLLFWSKHAAVSEWVLREARRAVDRQHGSPDEEPDITPIILEGPPVPEPIPDWLAHLHFNDHLVYLIARDRG